MSICFANSLVGATIIAFTLFVCFTFVSLSRIGKTKAAVFPVPV
jgi:hypothetical protein